MRQRVRDLLLDWSLDGTHSPPGTGERWKGMSRKPIPGNLCHLRCFDPDGPVGSLEV